MISMNLWKSPKFDKWGFRRKDTAHGAENKGRTRQMKKIVALLLVLALSVGMVGLSVADEPTVVIAFMTWAGKLVRSEDTSELQSRI